MIPVPKTACSAVKPYTTKDGSIVRELLHPDLRGDTNLSLAEALVPAGSETKLHRHMKAEEAYHVLEGRGIMTLGDQQFVVTAGDTISIAPGTPHRIKNSMHGDLKILCCCSPAYSHEDTELLSVEDD